MGRTQLQLAWRKLARGCEPSYSKSYSSLVSLFSYPLSTTEEFLWDGLALIQRGDEQFINEPHVGNAPKKLRFEGKPRAQRSARRARKGPRGNPVVSSKGVSYFNDMLGTTLGKKEKSGKYSVAAITAFGENLSNHSPTPTQNSNFFTGKPFVEGLGHAFLMRNYRASLAKWQTADPMGYPDGWNQLAYCGNGVVASIDFLGASRIKISETVTKDEVLTPWYEGVDDNGVSCEFRWHAQWYKITWALLDDGKNNAFDTLDWLELGGIGGGILVGAVGLAATTPAVAIAGFVIAIGSGVVYAIRQFEDDDQEYDINVLEKYDEEKFRTYREFRYAPE